MGASKLSWIVEIAVDFACGYYGIGTAIADLIDAHDTYKIMFGWNKNKKITEVFKRFLL